MNPIIKKINEKIREHEGEIEKLKSAKEAIKLYGGRTKSKKKGAKSK